MALTDIIVPGESDQLEEIPVGTLGTPNDMIAGAVALEELVLGKIYILVGGVWKLVEKINIFNIP